jgi:hypothetical protein
MDWMTGGADIATMAIGLSAVTAVATWIGIRWRVRQQEKAQTRARNWHGFIMVTGINDWYVRLIDNSKTPTAVIPVEIVDRYGSPNPAMAHRLREIVKGDGMLGRVPTQQEHAFLKFLNKKLEYGKGFSVR